MRNKPKKDLTFFQNYANHVKAIDKKLAKEMEYLGGKRTVMQEVSSITKGREPSASDLFLGHLNALDPLRDGYDYMDNVMGASIAPLVGTAVSLIFASKAIGDLFYSFMASSAGEKTRCQDSAALNGLYALASFAASIVTYVNSLIGLITRPAVTLAQGWNKSSEPQPRFRDDFSNEHSLAMAVTNALDI